MLRICARQGWTLSQWRALPEYEKTLWMGYEAHLQSQIDEWHEALTEDEKKMLYTAPVATMLRLARLGL